MKNTNYMFMNVVKSFVFSTITLLTFTSANAIEKKALIIGIGSYPQETGWSQINGDKDANVVEESLKGIGFRNTTKLINSQATKVNILDQLNTMLDSCQQGDVVLFYFAGHGQLILDYDADELDGYDESLVLYGAPKQYDALYKNENHLLDDELSDIINKFRIKLGPQGEFIVVIDAGFGWMSTSTTHITRGGAYPLEEKFESHSFSNIGKFESGILDDQPFSVPSKGHAHLFHLTANTINSMAMEVNGNGVLTLSFTRSLEELSDSVSYEVWFHTVQSHGNEIVQGQHIDAEGETDDLVFNHYHKIQGSDCETFAVEDVTETMSAQEMDMLKNIENYIQEEYNSDSGKGEFGSQ